LVTYLNGGTPIEYVRSDVSGDAKAIGPISLPADALNQPYVELQWKYYCVSGCGGTGKRAQLRLDDIRVVGQGPYKVRLPIIFRQ
jgi:hypothetical protein